MRVFALIALFTAALPAEVRWIEQSFGPEECARCAEALSARFRKMPGAGAVELDGKAGLLRIELEAGNRISLEAIADTLKGVGIRPGPARVLVHGTPSLAAGRWQLLVTGAGQSYPLEIRDPARLRAGEPILLEARLGGAAGKSLKVIQPEIVSVKKIWDAGPHNAFTDLIRFEDRWFCTFREAEAHVSGDGKLRVLVSSDGENWSSAALLTESGRDLRDPKFSIAPEPSGSSPGPSAGARGPGRLMIVAGGSVYEGTTLKGRHPRVFFSRDGREWSPPRPILAEGDWLWRATWREGVAYGVSYGYAPDGSYAAALFSAANGVDYKKVADFDVPGANEVTLRFLPSGEMLALVRRDNGDRLGWIGASFPPYKEWKWQPTQHRLGGPNFIRLPDGRLWAGSREYKPEGTRTAIALMTRDLYQPVLTLPSAGDSSYPGLVWHD
ncbi:MAG: hypothetical protein FJW37_03615, partial [Acidobacteria bacterium]|nr:hypothetical protein [Acidobacteriota bacterium]